MRRPHRSIETFDISLMAVVTKAMGAFLVLMLLLLPYYTPNPGTRQETQDLVRQLKAAGREIDDVLQQLNEPDAAELREKLEIARTELASALEIIARLRAQLDKALAEIARLNAENQKLAAANDSLAAENQRLLAENAQLDAEIIAAGKKILQLEDEIRQMDAEKRTLVAENTKLRETLQAAESEIAKLRREIEALNDKLKQDRRAAYVSINATGCDDVDLTGRILPRQEITGRLNEAGSTVKPEHIPYLYFGEKGGQISGFAREKVGKFEKVWLETGNTMSRNTFIISNADIKRDDYVVVILKQHRTEMWKLFGISVPLLAASSSDCQLTFVPTVRLAGNWESEVGQTAIIRAGSIGTPIVTIVGGENGVDIRPVRDDERAWIEDLVAKILAAQAAATPGAEPLEKAGEPK